MTILDITQDPNFERALDGVGGTHRGLRSFVYPFDENGVPHGSSASSCLLRVFETFKHLIPDYRHLNIQELAQTFLKYSNDNYKPIYIKNHPLGGVLEQSPLYQAFVDTAVIPEPYSQSSLDGLRAIILIHICTRSHDSKKGMEKLARLICEPFPEDRLPQAEQVASVLLGSRKNLNKILPRLLTLIAGPGYQHMDIPSMIEMSAADSTATPSEGWIRRYKASPGKPVSKSPKTGTSILLQPDGPAPELDAPEEIPADDLVDREEIFIPDLLPTNVEERVEALEELPIVDEWKTQAIHDYIRIRDTQLRLYGPLLPNTERVLTRLECKALIKHVETQTESAPDSPMAYESLFGLLGLVLMLVTGRHRDEVTDAIRHYLSLKAETSSIRLTDDFWCGSMPYSLPVIETYDPDWFEPVDDEVCLPLPEVVIRGLRYLMGCNHQFLDSRWTPVAITDALANLKRNLPRLSQSRIRTTLPSAVYAVTGHTRDWQLIIGDSGNRSTAPLHYYAPRLCELRESYRCSLETLGITVPSPNDQIESSNRRVGAPRAAIRIKKVRIAVDALRERTEEALQLGTRPSSNALLEAYNAMSVYTAVLFIATSTHRLTSRLGDLRRGDMLEIHDTAQSTYLGLVFDKGANQITSTRVVAMPDFFAQQIETLLWYAQRLTNQPGISSNTQWRQVRQALKASISGTGPVWHYIDIETQTLQALDRMVLGRCWRECGIPISLFRHLAGTNLSNYGLAGADIAQQMGHAVDLPPFDLNDPDSPLDFALRVSPKIDEYLRDLGFRPIRPVKRRNKDVPDLETGKLTRILKHARRDERAYQVHKLACQPCPTEDDKAFAENLVGEWMTKLPETDEWVVDPSALQECLGDYLDATPPPGQTVAVRERLVSEIARQSHVTNKNRPSLPPVVPLLLPISETRAVHMNAYRLTRELEKRLLTALTDMDGDKRPEIFCAIARLLLAIWGIGCSDKQQIPLLSDTTKLEEIPDTAGLAYLSYPTNTDYPEILAGQVIPMASVPLVYRLLEIDRTHPLHTFDNRETLPNDLGINEVLGGKNIKYKDVLRLIALARQITASGQRAAWERGDLESVGLSPDRLTAALHNQVISQPSENQAIPDLEIPRMPPEKNRTASKNYRALRKSLHDFNTKPGSSALRKKLIITIEGIIERHSPLELLCSIARDIKRAIDNPSSIPGLSSIYTYMTTLTPLIGRYHDKLISNVEPEILIEDLLTLVGYYQTASGSTQRKQSGTATSAISWIMNLLFEHGLDIDLSELDGLVLKNQQPGYVGSKAEIDAITDQVSVWNTMARNTPVYQGLGIQTTSALLGIHLQCPSAMRVRELCGLRSKDILLSGHELNITVSPRIKRSLKTKSSKRNICLLLAPNEFETIDMLMSQLLNRRMDTAEELLVTEYREPIQSIRNNYTTIRKAAAAPILGTRAGWTQIYRHTFGTAFGMKISHERMGELDLSLPKNANSDDAWNLPKRVIYRYHGRQMGHGSSITTATYYDHSIALQSDTQRGWSGPSETIQAKCLNLPTGTMRKRIQRYKHNHSTGRYWKEITPLYSESELQPSTPSSTMPTLNSSTASRVSLYLLANLGLRMREGLTGDVLANELGLSAAFVSQIEPRLQETETIAITGYLSPRKQNERSHSRRPRTHRLLELFSKLDDQLDQNNITASNLTDFLEKSGYKKLLPCKNHGAGFEAVRKIVEDFLSPGANNKATNDLTPTENQMIHLVLSTYVLSESY